MSPDQRPPAADELTGWSPGTGPDLGAAAEALATAELTIVGRLPWSSNVAFVVLVGDGPLHAVYKPGRGERPLWDFPDGLFRREVAAAVLSDALGWGLVPPTVLREDAPFGEGSVQLFVEADYRRHYFTVLEEGRHDGVLQAICAFDVVANNADRKGGHVLVGPDERLWCVDHGLCFHVHPKLRTVIWDFAGEELPTDLAADLRRVADDPPGELAHLLTPEELDELVARAAALLWRGHFPAPDSDRPYPWPLV